VISEDLIDDRQINSLILRFTESISPAQQEYC